MRDLYWRLAAGAQQRPATLLAFFPGVPPRAASDFIDGGHRLLRPQFVEQGLMLGEFHPASTVGSIHSPRLPVMRCPVAMFAVRSLTVHDLLFLDQLHTPPEARLTYLQHYRRYVGEQLSPAAATDLEDRIGAAHQAVREERQR